MKRTFTQCVLWGVFLTLSIVQSTAQTVLVSPTGDGGFETGATFAANGWTAVNGTQTNAWYAGSLVKNSGTNGAYVSNDAGVTNAYTLTATSVSHFYRDVTIPAGQTVLSVSFDFKGIGEFSGSSLYDHIRVYVAPTTVIPVAGTSMASIYQIGGTYNNAAVFTSASAATAVSPGTTVRVVFSWINDSSGGDVVGSAVDNISIVARTAATFTSAATGNWSAGATWVGGSAPSGVDNAVIADGHTVTIDAAGLICNNLTVGQGTSGILTYAATPTSFTVNGNLTVATGGTFNCYAGTTGKTLTLLGNLVNNGTIDLTYVSSILSLSGTTAQTISGTGNFTACSGVRQITLSNAAGATLNMPLTITGFLVLTNGVFTNGNNLTINNTIACGTATMPTVTLLSRTQLASLTSYPTIGAGAVLNVSYLSSNLGTNASTTEGFEIPANRTLNAIVINNYKGVNLTGGLTLTAAATAMTMTSGILSIPNASVITCSNSAYVGTTGGTASFVSGGSVALTLGTTSGSRSFPIGSGGFNRALVLANVAASSATTTLQASVLTSANGTAGAALAGLSATRRWVLTKTGSDITSTTATVALSYGLDDAFGAVVVADRKVAQSATAAGVFDNIGPVGNASTTVLTSSNVVSTPGLSLPIINAGTSYFALASLSALPPSWDGGAATTNWGDANNWSGNTVPTCSEDVFITQNVAVNLAGGGASYEARSIYVGANASLTMSDATKTLTVGSCGKTAGDNQSLSIDGGLTISSGTIKVNGKVAIATAAAIPAQFNMTGGALVIDGNDGTVAGSIPTANDLLNIGASSNTVMSMNLTGGTITIVDPPFTASSSSRAIAITLNSANVNTLNMQGSTIQFGDGVSTQVGTGTGGFIFDTYISTRNVRLGNVIVNAGSDPLRFVSGTTSTANAADIGGNLTVNAGSEIRSASSRGIGVVGNIINNGTISITSATSGVLLVGGFSGTTIGTTTPTTSPTISGSGVWRNNTTTASATASINGLTMDINGTLTLSAPLSIGGTLTMTNGNINTTGGTLSLGTGILPAAGTLATGTIARTSGMIVGPFERVMPAATIAAGNQLSLFPVGDGTNYAPLAINYTTAPAAIGTVTGQFVASNPGISGLPLLAYGGIDVVTASPTGYWSVTSSTADGQYTATGDASNFRKSVGLDKITDFANVRLIKRPKNGVFAVEGTASVPTAISALVITGLTAYGDFAVGGTAVAIPVELVFFKGNTEGSSNRLNWATATERNAALFVVERSKNGVSNWSAVAEQKAKGNSNALVSYTALDENPLSVSYYRLKMVDSDGKTQYSSVVTLVREKGKFGIAALYPVPTTDKATLEFEATEDQNVVLTIADVTGRVVSKQTIAARKNLNALTINVSDLPQGLYILSLNDGRQNAVTRFVKN